MDISQILDPDKVDKLFHAKAEYGQLFLFKSEKYITVFRPLTIKESETLFSLSQKLNICAVEDWVFRTCFVTGNKDSDYFLNNGPFLYVTHVATKIPNLSSIQEEGVYKKTIFELREKTGRMQDVIESIIVKAYGGIRDVKDLTQIKQFQSLVNAENITGEVLDITDKKNTKKALRQATHGATVLGGAEDITSPLVADKPDFNESFE